MIDNSNNENHVKVVEPSNSVIDKDADKKKVIDQNIVRRMSKKVLELIDKRGIKYSVLGIYYNIIHYIIFVTVTFNLLFSTNLNHLIVLLIIVILDGMSIIFLHLCPLTILEQKYLGTNICDEKTNKIKQMGIFYTCEHEYERQLELIINVWSLIAVKCLIIIVFRTFNYKLQDYNNIYVSN